jgi:hypothetical protein
MSLPGAGDPEEARRVVMQATHCTSVVTNGDDYTPQWDTPIYPLASGLSLKKHRCGIANFTQESGKGFKEPCKGFEVPAKYTIVNTGKDGVYVSQDTDGRYLQAPDNPNEYWTSLDSGLTKEKKRARKRVVGKGSRTGSFSLDLANPGRIVKKQFGDWTVFYGKNKSRHSQRSSGRQSTPDEEGSEVELDGDEGGTE